jgi:spore coat protein U-like protein
MTDSQRWWRLLMGVMLCAVLWSLTARQAFAAPSCTAAMTPLTFDNVDLVSGGTYTSTAALTYRCENDQTSQLFMRLCFNIGDGSASIASGGAHWNPRILRTTAGNEMNVQFYQGSLGTIWGSSSQVISDPYDVVVKMPPRNGRNSPSVTTGSFDLRGVIGTGQAALPNGTYTSDFAGNHTALRYTASSTSDTNLGDCNSANTSGGTFGFLVTANVVKSCVVSAGTALDFGTVDGIASSTAIEAQTAIQVTCSSPTAYNVLLIPSNNNAIGQGVMKGTSPNPDTVLYGLYRDAGRTQAWGNQQGTNSQTGTGNGAVKAFTVYGRVPNLPNVQPDNYSDKVTVNVTY